MAQWTVSVIDAARVRSFDLLVESAIVGVNPKKGNKYIEWRKAMDLSRTVYSRDLKITAMRALDAGATTAEIARK